MNTAETLKHGTTELAERAKKQAHAVASEAAERLSHHPEPPKRRRGRKLLFGAAIAGAAVALAKLVRRTRLGHVVEERVVDLTHRPTDKATVEGLDPVAMSGF